MDDDIDNFENKDLEDLVIEDKVQKKKIKKENTYFFRYFNRIRNNCNNYYCYLNCYIK